MDAQVQSVAFAHPRECNSSASNTAKNGVGEYLPMHAQVKSITFAYSRKYENSISNIEKMAQVADCAL